MSIEPLETAEGSDFQGCRQLSVFLENRIGQLLGLTRILDGFDVRILALSVEGSIDCAIVRLLVDDPDTARSRVADAGFAVAESEVIVVELPPGNRGILTVCRALISGEVNIHYTYPLLSATDKPAALAIQVDNLPHAVRVLRGEKFRVLEQRDL